MFGQQLTQGTSRNCGWSFCTGWAGGSPIGLAVTETNKVWKRQPGKCWKGQDWAGMGAFLGCLWAQQLSGMMGTGAVRTGLTPRASRATTSGTCAFILYLTGSTWKGCCGGTGSGFCLSPAARGRKQERNRMERCRYAGSSLRGFSLRSPEAGPPITSGTQAQPSGVGPRVLRGTLSKLSALT